MKFIGRYSSLAKTYKGSLYKAGLTPLSSLAGDDCIAGDRGGEGTLWIYCDAPPPFEVGTLVTITVEEHKED